MRKKGFTLVELMVVIAIIAILAAIALTAYRAYIRKAQSKELLTFARACVQESIAQCASDPNFNAFSSLDACNISSCSTQYIKNISVTSPTACNDLSASAIGEIDDQSYIANCTYSIDTDDVVCSAPRRQ